MKFKVLLFLVICISSCKQNENTVSKLFLENLIEDSDFYKEECNILKGAIETKYSDSGTNSEHFNNLMNFENEISKLLEEIKFENKEVALNLVNKRMKEINQANSNYTLPELENNELLILDNKTMHYYISYKFYKDLHWKYRIHLRKMPIFCGFKILSEKQIELIDLIEKSNIK